MKMTVGKAVKHRGEFGAPVSMEFDGATDGWHGNYAFATHGLKPADVVAKRDAIVAHHAAKSARLSSFQASLWGKVLRDGYVVTDCTIREQGEPGGAVELVLRVTTPDGGRLILDAVYSGMAALPNDSEIERIARSAVFDQMNGAQVAKNHENAVRQVLGLQ